MDISIITPIYYGNKFINNYIKMISLACENKENVEVILVNDSPEEKIKYNDELIKNFKLRIIENEKNMGIQRSRINGLIHAKGKYILFLDQDDEISPNCLKSQYELVDGYDIVIGNGYYEDRNEKHKIYNNNFSLKFSFKKRSMLKARNFIISPGQCLIKKDSISQYWINNSLTNNGADDYFLWLLMINNSAKINYNRGYVYTHSYTGQNLSLDNDKMYKSQLNMLDLLKKCDNYNKKDFKTIERTIHYKHDYKKNFLKVTIKNLDIFIYNLIYKLLWRGYTFHK